MVEYALLAERLDFSPTDPKSAAHPFSSAEAVRRLATSGGAVAYGLGDGSGLDTGASCDCDVGEDDVAFRDRGGAWVDARAWGEGRRGQTGGHRPPQQMMLCLEYKGLPGAQKKS